MEGMIKMHNFNSELSSCAIIFVQCFFKRFFLIDTITVGKGSDPDQNWGKLQDSDPNTLFL